MKILLASEGSNGDLFPILALAKELQSRGHDILIGAPPNNEDFIVKQGFAFKPIGLDYKKFMAERAVKIMGVSPLRSIGSMMNFLRAQTERHFANLLDIAKDVDYIFVSGLIYPGKSVAEYYGIGYKHIFPIPHVIPSKEYPPILVPNTSLPKWMNKFFWWSDRKFSNRAVRHTINLHREKLGLKPIKDVCEYLISDVVIPADPIIESIPQDVPFPYIQTGYWHLDVETEIEQEVLDFIEAGEPPVFIGFGSSTDPHPEQTQKILKEVIERSGRRFIISKGWANLGEGIDHDSVKIIGFTSYLKLFPKMAAVVHHGGAGTTHCVARSGVPHIIVPHALDGYHWGETIHRLGLGTKPISKGKLDTVSLLSAIEEIFQNTSMKNNANKIGEKLRKKDGVQEFMEIITPLLEKESSSSTKKTRQAFV